MHENLHIILYPDPRLQKASAPVETFGESLRQLAARMLELMREHRGVGLAAPQVALNVRLFVMNPTGEPGDDRVYVNPLLTDAEASEDDDEGCLSIPKLNVSVTRAKTIRLQARDLDNQPVDLTESGYIARIWQHEFDHLNGILITDRMGPVAKLANRRLLRDLESQYAAEHPAPPPPKKSPAKTPAKPRAKR